MYELDYGVILKTLRDIAAAMTYLHSLDMLHGDLTGSNIMLSSSDMDQRGFLAKVGTGEMIP
jgi:tRNA A-37 threonylcarbamoyl transferase component Bud32